MRELVFLGLRAEPQFVDVIDDLAQIVAALNLVFDLAEDLADLVLDGVRPAGLLLKAVQIGEELALTKSRRSSPVMRFVVVDLAVLAFGRGPAFPAVGLVENEGVFLPVQRRLIALSCSSPSRYFRNSSQEVCSV